MDSTDNGHADAAAAAASEGIEASFYRGQCLTAAQRRKLRKKQRDYEAQWLSGGANELGALESRLAAEGLAIHAIPADGNCLFRAIEHQLRALGGPEVDHRELRRRTVAHLRANRALFAPFVTSSAPTSADSSDGGHSGGYDAFGAYCAAMAADGEWGSELEVQALAMLLHRPIVVHKGDGVLEYGPTGANGANGADNPGPGGQGDPIRISYHKFQYILGAHYNSVVPL